jgi:hypothetical protein
MPLHEELSKGCPAGQALCPGKASLDACRVRERVCDEIAQYITWADLYEDPDSVVVPKSLNVIHPMDGRFQVGHQNSPDLSWI